MQRNESRQRAVLDGIADAIIVVDRSAVILSQNSAVRRVLGYAPEEFLGTRFFAFVHEQDWPDVYAAFYSVLEGCTEHATARFRHRANQDDAYRYIEATLGKLHDGSPECVVLSLRPSTAPSRPVLPGHSPATPDDPTFRPRSPHLTTDRQLTPAD